MADEGFKPGGAAMEGAAPDQSLTAGFSRVTQRGPEVPAGQEAKDACVSALETGEEPLREQRARNVTLTKAPRRGRGGRLQEPNDHGSAYVVAQLNGLYREMVEPIVESDDRC